MFIIYVSKKAKKVRKNEFNKSHMVSLGYYNMNT